VHAQYPLKWNKTWETEQNDLQEAELSRRYFRARRKALAIIRAQAEQVKLAHRAATSAEEEAAGAEKIRAGKADEVEALVAEAKRLEDDNPFQNQTSIRKMRKRADGLAAEAEAAAGQGAAAELTAMRWRRAMEDAEQGLHALVDQHAPLLQDKEEAIALLDWHASELPLLPPPLGDASAGGPVPEGGVTLPQIVGARLADSDARAPYPAGDVAFPGEHVDEAGMFSISRTGSVDSLLTAMSDNASLSSLGLSSVGDAPVVAHAESGGARPALGQRQLGLLAASRDAGEADRMQQVNRGSRPRAQSKETSRDELMRTLRSQAYQRNSTASFQNLAASGKLSTISSHQVDKMPVIPQGSSEFRPGSRSKSRPVSQQGSRSDSQQRSPESPISKQSSRESLAGGSASGDGARSQRSSLSPLGKRDKQRRGRKGRGERTASNQTSLQQSSDSRSPGRDDVSQSPSRGRGRQVTDGRPKADAPHDGAVISLPRI